MMNAASKALPGASQHTSSRGNGADGDAVEANAFVQPSATLRRSVQGGASNGAQRLDQAPGPRSGADAARISFKVTILQPQT